MAPTQVIHVVLKLARLACIFIYREASLHFTDPSSVEKLLEFGMMDLEGGQTSKRDDEKPMEGLSRQFHHSLNLNKVIIWMTALVIAADVFIVLYRSGYPNSPSLPTSRDSKEYSFASQSFSFGQAKNVSSSSSTTSGDHSCSANRSSPNPQVSFFMKSLLGLGEFRRK